MKIDELPESIILKDNHFKACLSTIIETVKIKIWNSVDLISHYAKHRIDHSERIVQYLGELLDDFPTLLNQQERFVLLVAIFLHDIGNKLPKYVGIPIKLIYSIEELEIIRKNHHLSSYKAVKDSIKVNSELPLGLDLCKDYTDFIALLCKYHRKLDLKYLKDTSIASDPLRLHLLGALLRLGDELDADYRRVDMEVLNIIDIPPESKFYWWSHHYVQSISVNHGHIKLFFRFPEEYKKNNIVEIFKTKRKESLREQFLEVYDIFENYGVRLYRDIEMGEPNYLSAGSLKQVPPDLLDYIKTTITQTGRNYTELYLKTGLAWKIDGVLYSDNEKVVQAVAKIPQLMEQYEYPETIKIIEDIHLLKMSPKDKMIFSGIAGNCYLVLCYYNEAKSYYMDQLKLTERRDLKNVYKLETILARSVSLGNMGKVYRIQGELKEALNKFKESLEIFKTLSASVDIEDTIKIIKDVEEEIKYKVVDDIIQNNQEKSRIKENAKKPEIFLSYSHKNKEIADRVDKFFISKNIRLTRDVRDAPAYSSLKKFMDTIRNYDYVIILISDAYLKSTNCMYEVIQFIQERNYSDRTFPIVIDNEATIFDQSKHSKYIHYWQTKYKELGDEIKTLQNTGTISLHKELDKIDKIQSNIGDFLNKISDLKCIPLNELESINYKAILDKIGNIFNIPRKEEIEIKSEELKLKIIGCLYKWYIEGIEEGKTPEFNVIEKINEWKVSSKLMYTIIDEIVDDGYLEWSTFGHVWLKKEGRLLARKEKLDQKYDCKECGESD